MDASEDPNASGASFARRLVEARPMVVAALASHLGDLDAAEEAFADACVALTESGAEPDHLAGWLITVGKRKAIDRIRKRDARQRADNAAKEIAEGEMPSDWENVFQLPEAIPDERLRLIFICCHPALALEARAALALKVICGLDVPAIAELFLTSEATMFARITRAKAKIRDARVSFELPPRREWPERVEAVLLALELAYTSAYSDAGGSRAGNEGG
ncbi:MAG: sigma factor-like helix-turn-helix DNA-binding protein, partial [Pseudomonadota bacterium]